jgi:tetratricopeptide (TPR) repeat protein
MLEGTLAAQVVERTAGNPLFAVQLVADWVQQGLLHLGPSGFALRPGRAAALPDSLHELSQAQIAGLLEGLPEQARDLLERAAVLGRVVDEVEWAEVSDDPTGKWRHGSRQALSIEGARLRRELVERLIDRRLVEETESGFAFGHAMLRESLERAAEESGRAVVHHRACAEMLQRHLDAGMADVAERLGRHRVAAGDFEGAIGPLLAGVDERLRTTGYRPALSLLGFTEEAMRQRRLASSDRRWGRAWLMRSELFRLLGDLDEAERWAARVDEGAGAHGWTDLRLQAALLRVEVALSRNDADLAEIVLNGIERDFPERDPATRARALMLRADVRDARRDTDGAARLREQALSLFRRSGNDAMIAQCLRAMTLAPLRAGEHARARAMFEEARSLFDKVGDRYGVAACLTGLGEALRAAGDLAAAETAYARSLAMFESIGSPAAAVTRCNLGIVAVARNDWDGARRPFEDARADLEGTDRREFLAAVHAGLLGCAAADEDWTSWDAHYQALVSTLESTRTADPDIAWLAERAADVVAPRDSRRGQALLRIAMQQWRRLGQGVPAHELEDR